MSVLLIAVMINFLKKATICLDSCMNIYQEQPSPSIQYAPINTNITYTCTVANNDLEWQIELDVEDTRITWLYNPCQIVFIQQPSSEPQPIDNIVTYNCTLANDDISWNIELPGSSISLQFDGSRSEQILNDQGIVEIMKTVDEVSTSVITVNASQANNETEISCRTLLPDGTLCAAEISLVIYDQPSPPKHLRVSGVNIQVIIISWFTESIPGVGLTYSMSIMSLNSSSQLLIEGLIEPLFVFNATQLDSTSPCDVYVVQVTAANGAGPSDPSEPLTTMLPSLPRIQPVNDSLNQMVSKTEQGEIRVQLSYQHATTCSSYPIRNYTVTMSAANGNVTKSIGGEVTEVPLTPSDGVEENMVYSYFITASNEVGSVSTDERELYTTDVQDVNVLQDKNDGFLNICCQFIEGSNAKGCLVRMEWGNGRNLSAVINRRTNETFLRTEQAINNSTLTPELIITGFDIEEDGSIGRVGVPGKIGSCNRLSEGETGGTSHVVVTIVITVSVVVIIIFALIITTTTLMCCIYRTKNHEGEPDTRKNPAYELRNPTHLESNTGAGSAQTSSSVQMVEPVYDNAVVDEFVPVSDNSAYGTTTNN